MKKTQHNEGRRKLELNRETVRNLSDKDLEQIAGGHIPTRISCWRDCPTMDFQCTTRATLIC